MFSSGSHSSSAGLCRTQRALNQVLGLYAQVSSSREAGYEQARPAGRFGGGGGGGAPSNSDADSEDDMLSQVCPIWPARDFSCEMKTFCVMCSRF